MREVSLREKGVDLNSNKFCSFPLPDEVSLREKGVDLNGKAIYAGA